MINAPELLPQGEYFDPVVWEEVPIEAEVPVEDEAALVPVKAAAPFSITSPVTISGTDVAYYGTQAAIGWMVGGPVGALVGAGLGWAARRQEPDGLTRKVVDIGALPGRFVAGLLE